METLKWINKMVIKVWVGVKDRLYVIDIDRCICNRFVVMFTCKI